MNRWPALLSLLCTALAAPVAAAERGGANDLLRVIAPASKASVPAHPFVNVVVGFGTTKNGTPADRETFRARLGRVDVTPLFRPVVERGVVVGMRAETGPALLRIGPRSANRLRFEVRGGGRGGPRVRDVDRVRFRAVDELNQPPAARLVTGERVILPRIPLQFDGTQSADPEGDELTYEWDFGDGETSNEPKPQHVFEGATADVTVRLTVRDGQDAASETTTLLAVPPIDEGRTPGILKVEGAEPLEFGPVAPGAAATRTFRVRNADGTDTSQLVVRLGLDNPTFRLEPNALDLGPGESAPVDVVFTPTGEGHQGSEISLVASATNQNAVHLLAHGYGGSAPGTGPLPVASTLFYNIPGRGTQGILPSGARFRADNAVRSCQLPNGRLGDYCLTDADCVANGGTCPTTGVCLRGDRAGEPCSVPSDCPNGYCSAASYADPADMCADGQGGLFILTDEGTYTDPNPSRETELASSIFRLQFDAAGNRTDATLLTHETESTTQIACDGIPTASNGRLYVPEYHNVTMSGDCFRDAREALVTLRKSTGGDTTLMPRIDAVAGLPDCEDYDPVADMQVTRDGVEVFVSFELLGLWRIRPTPLFITPDVDADFKLHPDGSVIVVTVRNEGTTGILRVYKISPDQAVHGASLLRDLTPCVTLDVPNNRGGQSTQGRAYVGSSAVDRTTPASFDGTILLSFFTTGASATLDSALQARGTFAILSPAASSTCQVLGLVNLEALDQMAF